MTRPYGVPPPGFHLPDDTHVGSVHLQVRDLDTSLRFYAQVLGLRALDRTGSAASLGVPDGGHPLIRLHANAGVRHARRGAFGLYHYAILLPDRGSLGRFAAHLARRGVEAGMADHLVSEAIYLSDPDGLGIEVYADRPRSAWRHHDRELAMTTDPLDVEDVMAAGGGAAWDGAPPGTTVGHVHLHVGNLRDAEAYYHGALGFEKVVWSYPGALFFSAGGYHHHLGTNTWSRGPSAREDEARLLEWQLVLPDAGSVRAAERSLREGGYSAAAGDTDVVTRDPWGTVVRLTSAVG